MCFSFFPGFKGALGYFYIIKNLLLKMIEKRGKKRNVMGLLGLILHFFPIYDEYMLFFD